MKHLKFFVFLCILTFTVSCGQQNAYIQYKVKKGETMSSIARNLNMKTKDLLRLNPDIVDDLKIDSFIVVPEKKLNNFNSKQLKEEAAVEVDTKSEVDKLLEEKTKLLNKLKETYVIHEIVKGDTFYNLGKKYNVTSDELLALNPVLVDGLKLGQIIKIKELPFNDSSDENKDDNKGQVDYIKPNTYLKVALLLPFKADQYTSESVTSETIFNQNSSLVNIATDFYMGAEIAIDSLRNKGLKIQLNVYDTGNRNTNDINRILSNKGLSESDVVIGPLYSEEVNVVANSVNIPVIFPVYSSSQSEFRASNIVKTEPEKEVYRSTLISYIKENLKGGNIIIVSDEKEASLAESRSLKSSLEHNSGGNSVQILTPSRGYIAKSRVTQIFKPNAQNWIILDTESSLVISDIINNLNSLPKSSGAKVFTFEKGSVYDNVDNNKLARLGFTFVSDEFVDENADETKAFNGQYYKKNNAVPSFYATKGFDITYDVLVRLASGKDLKSSLKDKVSYRVESKFDYRKSRGVLENIGLFIIQYNEDLTLTKLK